TLQGHTVIGEGCRVQAGSVLVDATLEPGAAAGPMAYLRPGTVLRAGARAGTFVEIKNSDIGPGTKVPHLSYIGDADVGEGANLGAGTITANLPHRTHRKQRTKLGRRVKTGIHTPLMAPLTVGDRAYTEAGSVIVDDVPEGAL